LLDELNWSKKDLKEFLSRWKEMRNKASSGDVQSEQKFEQELKSLGIKPTSLQGQQSEVKKDDLKGLRQDAARATIPFEMIDSFKAFQKGKARRETQQK